MIVKSEKAVYERYSIRQIYDKGKSTVKHKIKLTTLTRHQAKVLVIDVPN